MCVRICIYIYMYRHIYAYILMSPGDADDVPWEMVVVCWRYAVSVVTVSHICIGCHTHAYAVTHRHWSCHVFAPKYLRDTRIHKRTHTHTHIHTHTHTHKHTHTQTHTHIPNVGSDCLPPSWISQERWGAGVETQKNVRGEIVGWGRAPFNEPYAPLLSTIYDGA